MLSTFSRHFFSMGAVTLVSRLLGFIREVAQVQVLGVSGITDAFLASSKIPHFFRHLLADGALSGSFLPHLVPLVKKGEEKKIALLCMTAFIFFQMGVFFIFLILIFFPSLVKAFLFPGFPALYQEAAFKFLCIQFPLLFFLSAAALSTAYLQSKGYFSFPAWGQVVTNISYLFFICMSFNHPFPHYFLSGGVLVSGGILILFHLFGILTIAPLKITFPSFLDIKENVRPLVSSFVPYAFGVGASEIQLLVVNSMSSFAAPGHVTLLALASRFVQFPLGVIAVSFSSILLPLSCKYKGCYKKNSYLLGEACKAILLLVFPVFLFFFFHAPDIYATLLKKENAEVHLQAAFLLRICLIGLFPAAINRVCVSFFHAHNDTISPARITLASSFSMVALSAFLLVKGWGAYGIAFASVVGSWISTFLNIFYLMSKHKIYVPWRSFSFFCVRLFLFILFFSFLYKLLFTFILLKKKILLGCTTHNLLIYWGFTLFLFFSTLLLAFMARRYGSLSCRLLSL